MPKILPAVRAAVAAGVALAAVAPARADAPTITTSTLHLGPFVDGSTCSFPITTTVDRIRTTTTFADGDQRRHVDLTVDQTASQIFVDGRLVYLQSGLLAFDAVTGDLTDPHPGPLAVSPDICTALDA